jgi:hypothetical protein
MPLDLAVIFRSMTPKGVRVLPWHAIAQRGNQKLMHVHAALEPIMLLATQVCSGRTEKVDGK